MPATVGAAPPRKFPWRQARTGPMTMATRPGTTIGTKVASKYCGPTDNLTPLHTSAKSG